jgi:DNA polymerase IIIc chi subunit
MTQISFFHGARDRLQAVAAWLARAGSEGRRVMVYVPANRSQRSIGSSAVDPAGYRFRTPHCRAGDPLAAETPIILAPELDSPLHDNAS